MKPKTLRVRASGMALVCDLEALQGGARRFIGRDWDQELGGWAPRVDSTEVPYRAEYVQHIKEGSLEPADQDTAKACGVKFVGAEAEKA